MVSSPPPPPFHSVLLNKPDQLLKAVPALFRSSVTPRFERQRLCRASLAFRPTDSCGSTLRHLPGFQCWLQSLFHLKIQAGKPGWNGHFAYMRDLAGKKPSRRSPTNSYPTFGSFLCPRMDLEWENSSAAPQKSVLRKWRFPDP